MKEVICARVDFYPVEAGFSSPLRCLAVPFDQFLDLVDGKRVGRLVLMDVELRFHCHCGGGHCGCPHVVNSAPWTPMVKLHEGRALVLMYGIGELPDIVYILVVVEAKTAVPFFHQRPLHGRRLDDHQTRAALCQGAIEGLRKVTDPLLPRFEEVCLVRCFHEPVLQLHPADAAGREQFFELPPCHHHPPVYGTK